LVVNINQIKDVECGKIKGAKRRKCGKNKKSQKVLVVKRYWVESTTL